MGACTTLHDTRRGTSHGGALTTGSYAENTEKLDGASSGEVQGYLAFVAKAMAQPCPLGLKQQQVPNDVLESVQWLAKRSSKEVRAARENVTKEIEKAAAALETSGATSKWLAEADAETKRISVAVNGPLGEMLVRASGFTDTAVMEVFRRGGPIAGKLEAPVGSTSKAFPEPTATDELKKTCERKNKELLNSLREDPHSDFLMEQTLADAAAGRMTAPLSDKETSLSEQVVCRRFSREQGRKSDGSLKLRAVDDETGSGTNSTTQPTAKLHCDGADALVSAAVLFTKLTGEVPSFWKADVDKAYRRLPVAPEQRWLLGVAFKHFGTTWIAQHNAMPFGSVASVHAWDRVGAFLRHVGRKLLKLPLGRYVDDFFAVDREADAEHAMECFARVTRAILGEEALAKAKLEQGRPLGVLGLLFTADNEGVSVRVNEDKTQKLLKELEDCLKKGKLSAGNAAKLAGRLSFAAQHTFRKLGRAMLRPLFQQEHAPLPGGKLGDSLKLALKWWQKALALKMSQKVLVAEETEVVELFCDARGSPPRLAAVLFADGRIQYTDLETPEELLKLFEAREDAQIMGQELLAIAVGLCTFMESLRGRCVRVWTDNKGGECALRSGAARAGDHNLLIHAMWLLAAKEGFGLWIERVQAESNEHKINKTINANKSIYIYINENDHT